MNRIVDLQRRLRERGRIRIGYSVPSTKPNAKAGTKVPKKLDRFRFTAPDRATIEMVAQLYGGSPEAWPDRGDDQWQVTTDARQLPVVFATRIAFSQSYEQWSGGFLERLCDGETAHVPSTTKRMRAEPCSCDPEERVCKITTHLGLILPELAGLGTWRLVTHGYYAATELLGAVELIEGAIAHGLVRVPARLMVERREVRRLVDGKPTVHKFAVPVLDLDMGVMALGPAGPGGLIGAGPRTIGTGSSNGTAELAVPEPSGWQPVDQQALPAAPAVSVAERVAEVDQPRPRRANSAPEIPRTGTKPRPAADADSGVCGVCGKPYGRAPVRRDPEPERGRYIHTACLDEPEDEGPPAAAVEDRADEPDDDEPDGLSDDDEDDDESEVELLDDEEVEAFAEALGIAGDDEPSPYGEPVDDAGMSPGDDGDGPGDEGVISGPVVRAGPATRRGAAMTFGQQRKLLAMAGEAIPVAEDASSADADAIRKTAVLQLAGLCGQPGLTSRSQISSATAVPLIDVLQAIVDGAMAFEDGEVTDTRTGELVTFEAPA